MTMQKKQQLKNALRPIVESILGEETAYQRGADRNFRKKLNDIIELNNIYIRQIDRKILESDQFDRLIDEYVAAIKDFKMYSKSWDG